MVKNLHLKGTIEFADPEAVFSFLYQDDAFAKWYHKEVNDDPDVIVTNWDEDRKREVTFKARMRAPPVIIRQIVGGDTSQVMEVQQYTKHDSSFTIHSDVSATLNAGFSLITSADTILSPAEKGGCSIDVNVTLELKGFLIQGLAEEYVEKHTESAFERWMNLARIFCEERMGLAKERLVEEEDLFHDIDDSALDDVLPMEEGVDITPISDLQKSPSTRQSESPSGLHESFVHEIQRTLRFSVYISKKLRKIETELLSLRSSLKSFDFFPLKAWSFYGFGIATGLALGLLLCVRKANK